MLNTIVNLKIWTIGDLVMSKTYCWTRLNNWVRSSGNNSLVVARGFGLLGYPTSTRSRNAKKII